ncbi:hypothetical protein HUT18_00695 [Streptomyces sp. NA04227]|nr:hypothetical protein [Streptomyces sp. NA04227]QKW05094.1 hypothetical protein HUT18_00695 [Streptomyces sp. NA04227]
MVAAADLAHRRTWEISTAEAGADHDARDEAARQAVEAFVTRAAPLVR